MAGSVRSTFFAAGVAVAASGLAATAILATPPAHASGSVTESFTGVTLRQPSNWVSKSTSISSAWPCLTGLTTGSNLPLGDSTSIAGCGALADDPGVLQLVAPDPNGRGTSFTYNKPVSLTSGLDVTFSASLSQPAMGAFADGMVFFLKDASNVDYATGGPGGAMGYGIDSGAVKDGISGALLGVALDSYGNSPNPYYEGASCPSNTFTFSSAVSTLTVRGPGSGQAGYCLIGTQTVSGLFSGSTRAEGTRRVRITITPTTSGQDPLVSVFVEPSVGAGLPTTPQLEVTAAFLADVSSAKFGFSAGNSDYTSLKAEVWDLRVAPLVSTPRTTASPTPTVTAEPVVILPNTGSTATPELIWLAGIVTVGGVALLARRRKN